MSPCARIQSSARSGHVRGLGVRLCDARRQVHVAHLPSGREAPAGIDADHVVAPRIRADVTMFTEEVGVARLRPRRRVAVVPIEHREPALAQERAALRLDFDPEALDRLVVRQHVRLSGERCLAPRSTEIVAERVLRGGERHAVPRRPVRAHVAPGVIRHPRRPADARLDIGVVETHAELRQPVEVGCGHLRRAVAGDMIAPQLVAHHEQHVADGSHGWATDGEDGTRALPKRIPRCARTRVSAIMPPLGRRGNAALDAHVPGRDGGTGRRSGLKIRRW